MARALRRDAVFYWAAWASAPAGSQDEAPQSLLIRAADALEKGSSDRDTQLVEELRKAAHQIPTVGTQPQLPKPDPNTYWVVPGQLLAGEYPGARDPEKARSRLRRFLAAGVRHFIDLTEPGELEPDEALLMEEAGSGISYERIPIRDVSVPKEPKTVAEIIAAIDCGMAEGGITYVHCWGGVGRTGLAVACWLQEQGKTPEEALTNLADKWRSCAKSNRKPSSPETAEQVGWVKERPVYRSKLNLE